MVTPAHVISELNEVKKERDQAIADLEKVRRDAGDEYSAIVHAVQRLLVHVELIKHPDAAVEQDIEYARRFVPLMPTDMNDNIPCPDCGRNPNSEENKSLNTDDTNVCQGCGLTLEPCGKSVTGWSRCVLPKDHHDQCSYENI